MTITIKGGSDSNKTQFMTKQILALNTNNNRWCLENL